MITQYTRPEALKGGRGRVLVVDDNPVNQRVVHRMLEKMGYDVDVANNGVVAVACVSRALYDAVLMDCQMPVMDGFEATREIRRQEEGTDRHTLIIAVTGGAMMGDDVKCLDAAWTRTSASRSWPRAWARWWSGGPSFAPGLTPCR